MWQIDASAGRPAAGADRAFAMRQFAASQFAARLPIVSVNPKGACRVRARLYRFDYQWEKR
jgi:hypothetical protein